MNYISYDCPREALPSSRMREDTEEERTNEEGSAQITRVDANELM
jgi:hypothetical protein